MTGARAAVRSASCVLEHVPDLVRYGSKPAREPQRLPELASALRPFDETGHRGLVQPQERRQIGHARSAVAQEAEQPQLRERQVVLRTDAREHGHHPEGRPDESVFERVVRSHAGIVLDMVCITN